jgi:hypothetical protein
MMGTKTRSFAPLPDDVSLEGLVPEDHFYRRLEARLDLSFVRELVAPLYASARTRRGAGRRRGRRGGRRPVVGRDRVATLLSRFRTIAPDAVVADGRITRIYAIRNPHKLARLEEEATLSR